MFGGGFFSSYIKHSKIRDAEALLERAKEHLLVFQRELKDVGGVIKFTDRGWRLSYICRFLFG